MSPKMFNISIPHQLDASWIFLHLLTLLRNRLNSFSCFVNFLLNLFDNFLTNLPFVYNQLKIVPKYRAVTTNQIRSRMRIWYSFIMRKLYEILRAKFKLEIFVN